MADAAVISAEEIKMEPEEGKKAEEAVTQEENRLSAGESTNSASKVPDVKGQRPLPIWWTEEIAAAIKERRTVRKLVRKYQNKANSILFRKVRSRTRYLIRDSKIKHGLLPPIEKKNNNKVVEEKPNNPLSSLREIYGDSDSDTEDMN